MYVSKCYVHVNRETIAQSIREEGFDPVLISDSPGTTYPPHHHPETKLLAFLQGSMELMIQGERYHCGPGDRIVIPGNLIHAALVGSDGCKFFWSERIV